MPRASASRSAKPCTTITTIALSRSVRRKARQSLPAARTSDRPSAAAIGSSGASWERSNNSPPRENTW